MDGATIRLHRLLKSERSTLRRFWRNNVTFSEFESEFMSMESSLNTLKMLGDRVDAARCVGLFVRALFVDTFQMPLSTRGGNSAS